LAVDRDFGIDHEFTPNFSQEQKQRTLHDPFRARLSRWVCANVFLDAGLSRILGENEIKAVLIPLREVERFCSNLSPAQSLPDRVRAVGWHSA
jgi:hypothetical protein